MRHDDGTRSRELAATVHLPAIPRVGDRVRAGRAGSYFSVERVLFDDADDPMLVLADTTDRDTTYSELLLNGWRLIYEARSIPRDTSAKTPRNTRREETRSRRRTT
jgi:hypothetical protein